jgi:hypothetical protein
MKTIFLTEKSSQITRLNDKIEDLTSEGYKVVSFKVVGSAVLDQYNHYTVIVVQLNKD